MRVFILKSVFFIIGVTGLLFWAQKSPPVTLEGHVLAKTIQSEIRINKPSRFSNMENHALIEQIKNIRQVPYIQNCNDAIFQEIMRRKLEIVPFLLSKLTDTTPLAGYYVPNFGGEYRVADVAYILLQEIIADIPTFKLIDKPFSKECGYCSYWEYVRKSLQNRKQLQSAFEGWYKNNKKKLVWMESQSFLTGDCRSNLSKGHYKPIVLKPT